MDGGKSGKNGEGGVKEQTSSWLENSLSTSIQEDLCQGKASKGGTETLCRGPELL